MTPKSLALNFCGEHYELCPEKAFHWPRGSLLALGDVHLGKAESLQKSGIPIPNPGPGEDLGHLKTLIERTRARRVFILGDWIHHRSSWSEGLLRDLAQFFVQNSNIEWTLILGNHDRGSNEQLSHFPMRLVRGVYWEGGLALTHGHHDLEKADPDRLWIQGHVHPVIRLQRGSTRLRLPCFYLEKNELTLPSFGRLTGGYEIESQAGRRIFPVTPQEVFALPSRAKTKNKIF